MNMRINQFQMNHATRVKVINCIMDTHDFNKMSIARKGQWVVG